MTLQLMTLLNEKITKTNTSSQYNSDLYIFQNTPSLCSEEQETAMDFIIIFYLHSKVHH